MEEADKALREAVLSSGYTDEEAKALARAKTPDAVQRLVAARNKHLVDLYRAQVVEFRARIPQLRAEWDRKMDAYAAFRNAIDRFNNVDTTSRSITDESMRCTQMLDTIEAASLNVHVADLSRVEADPRAHFTEISSTIELLFDLVPKRVQRQQEKTSV
jgi:predicted S18 family serine protease